MQKLVLKLFVSLIVFSLLQQCSSKKESETKQFNWLVGEWTAQRPSGTIKEVWHQGNANTLKGMSYLKQKGKDSTLLETMEFVKKGKEYNFMVTGADNADQVIFTLTRQTDSSFMVVNMNHDFPKRISYRLIQKDSMFATIDDGNDSTQMKEEYYFAKKK
jgi:hypothetical protein